MASGEFESSSCLVKGFIIDVVGQRIHCERSEQFIDLKARNKQIQTLHFTHFFHCPECIDLYFIRFAVYGFVVRHLRCLLCRLWDCVEKNDLCRRSRRLGAIPTPPLAAFKNSLFYTRKDGGTTSPPGGDALTTPSVGPSSHTCENLLPYGTEQPPQKNHTEEERTGPSEDSAIDNDGPCSTHDDERTVMQGAEQLKTAELDTDDHEHNQLYWSHFEDFPLDKFLNNTP